MSRKPAPKLRHRRLFLEGLEQRAMLAGNVTASVSAQTLFIRGNNLDNGVAITQLSPTSYLVTGVPDPGTATPTTVNGGAASFIANNVRNFDVDLGAGNDFIAIGNNVAFLQELAAEAVGGPTPAPGVASDAVTLRGSATIRMGTGNDAVGIQLSTPSFVSIQTGAGSDGVAVEAGNEGALTILSDAGDQRFDAADVVRVRGVNLTGALNVTTLAGDDVITVDTVKASFIGVYSGVGATIPGVTDKDVVIGNNLTSKSSVDVVTLAGSDDVNLLSIVSNNVLIDTGEGNDIATLENFNLKTTKILGQGGDDHIDIFAGPLGGITVNLFVDAGSGNDGVHLFGAFVEDGGDEVAEQIGLADDLLLGAATLLTGSGNDGLVLQNVHVLNNLFMDMGAGDDSADNGDVFFLPGGLSLDAVTVDKIMLAYLGSGNDTAQGRNVTAAKGSAIYGGIGNDRLTDGGGNSPNIKPYEFESIITLP